MTKKTYDFIIIGMGLSGLFTAYHLLKKGGKSSILLLDEKDIGDKASGRNAGFLTYGSSTHFQQSLEKWGLQKTQEMYLWSQRNLKAIREEIIQDDTEILTSNQKGSITLYHQEQLNDGSFEQIKRSLEENKDWMSYEIKERHDLDAYIKTNHCFERGISFLQNEYSLNPQKLLEKIKKEISPQVTFQPQTKVHECLPSSHTPSIQTNKGSFSAKKIILATNSYFNELLPHSSIKVFPKRAQMVSYHIQESLFYGNFFYSPGKLYFRQHQNELYIGGMRHLGGKEEDTTLMQENPIILAGIDKFLSEHFPSLQKKEIRRWSGIMGFSSTALPYAQEIPEYENFYFLGGYSAHGLGLSYVNAEKLVDNFLI